MTTIDRLKEIATTGGKEAKINEEQERIANGQSEYNTIEEYLLALNDPSINYYTRGKTLFLRMSIVMGVSNYDVNVLRKVLATLENKYKDEVDNFIFINRGNGGSVFAGLDIRDRINEFLGIMRFKKTSFVVSSLVASASTMPMSLFDEILFTEGASLLIHDVSSFMMGNTRQMTDELKSLKNLSDTLRDMSLSICRNEKGRDFVNRVIDEGKDEFINSEDAIAYGICDGMYNDRIMYTNFIKNIVTNGFNEEFNKNNNILNKTKKMELENKLKELESLTNKNIEEVSNKQKDSDTQTENAIIKMADLLTNIHKNLDEFTEARKLSDDKIGALTKSVEEIKTELAKTKVSSKENKPIENKSIEDAKAKTDAKDEKVGINTVQFIKQGNEYIVL